MREVARIIDGVICTDGFAPPPAREITVHHHHYHHTPAPVVERRPAPAPRSTPPPVPARIETVDQISDQLENIVRSARTMDERDRREVYRTLHGSISLVAAMISLRTK